LFYLSNVTFKNLIKYPSINIKENQATFVCGKSGSGKSTLLKLLNASISPDNGEILYHEKPITDYDTILLRREIILVSQNVFLFDHSIRDNFIEFYRYRELPAPSDQLILQFLHLCLADFLLDTNCHEMSGGERQRVFIAICFSFLPKVIMLDEPTSSLDENTASLLMGNLKQYCHLHKISLIVITHDRLLAEKFADELIVLDSEVSPNE